MTFLDNMLRKINRTSKFLLLFLLALVIISCKTTQNTPYYKIQLGTFDDYTHKFEKLIDYLAVYDDDETTICNSVLRDLTVFEFDIDKEINGNMLLSVYQVDTMKEILRQVTALRKFVDCIGNCTAHPAILENELIQVADLLQFRVMTIQETTCAKVIQLQKERFLFYFLINKTNTYHNMRYTYMDFDGENKSGVTDVPPFAATVLTKIFNDYFSEIIIIRSLQCR
jgi:hypothetical protein